MPRGWYSHGCLTLDAHRATAAAATQQCSKVLEQASNYALHLKCRMQVRWVLSTCRGHLMECTQRIAGIGGRQFKLHMNTPQASSSCRCVPAACSHFEQTAWAPLRTACMSANSHGSRACT